MGAKGSQGVTIWRESSAAGSTAEITTTNTISFDSTLNTICRQAGFADFSTGMNIAVEASLNEGVYSIKTTDSTYVVVREPLVAQASGGDVSIVGHAIQEIGQIVSFNGPSLTAAVIDITNLKSTAKEKLISIYDSGQVGLSVIYDHDSSGLMLHDALIRDMQAKTKRTFDIHLTGTSTATTQQIRFGGYMSGCNITGSVDNALKADLTIALASGVNFSTNKAT